ncbi:hypothetical protein KC19_1G082300 [Ceratodon purpureus]|uniref:Uncharacterized protein n=1 Tax=Ceratodon purpureus TaxID=3225 RepID=A0A8T0J5Y1_CERPU|nr:hypothetical protein KC19_1G082300 [Ceratodon purpureus]
MSKDKRFRKVAFAEIAVQRLRSRLPSKRTLNKTGELSITVSDSIDQTLVEEIRASHALVDSDTSDVDTDSEVGQYRGGSKCGKSPGNLSTSSTSASKAYRGSPASDVSKDNYAPEKSITLFAFRLTILEKTARGTGALTFVWATVVLLGGFSQYLSGTDFWVVTILLLTEGSRIFLLSNELEWQQARTRSSFSLYELGSNLAHRSSHIVSGLVRHSQGDSSSSDEGAARSPSPWPPRHRHNGVPGYGTPTSQAPSPAPQTAKRDQRIAETLRSKTAPRTWSASMLPLLPYTQVVSAKGMATFLYIGQVVSALLCLALSLWRLILHDFLDPGTPDNLKDNITYSLYAFYAMALVEAFIFLVEKMYWEYKISYKRLFERVDRKSQLKSECVDTIRSFFYTVYSTSLTTSVFTGLTMDLVSYSMELLQSNDEKEVLGGSKILKAFVERSHASHSDTLRRIGITPGAIDRLVEMLAWHHKDEREIRLNSAAIVKALVSSTRNGSRVIAVSGSLENIMSLIQWDDVDRLLHVEGENAAPPPGEVIELRTYGLGILKYLALEHTNCVRIGDTRGLLVRLVDFVNIHGVHGSSITSAEGCKTIRQSLQVLKLLASTTGSSGSILRPAIANVVSTIPHLRDILHSPARAMSRDLHEHAVDVLKSLALDKHSREVIGSTGGVISNLMFLFTRGSLCRMPSLHEEASAVKDANLAKKAGKVLMRLALQNMENCNRILRTRFREPHLRASTVLLQMLHDEENKELGILSAQILRGTFIYMTPTMQEEVSQHSEFLLKRVISTSDRRVQEAALGLATVLQLPSLTHQEFINLFEHHGVNRNKLVDSLLECLNHAPSTTRRPRIRRYAMELIFVLLSRDEAFKGLFSDRKLPSVLITMLDNISDVENYLLFSGGMGLTRHKEDMEFLVLRVLDMFDVDGR